MLNSQRDPIASFGTAEQVARFLLHESFGYAHRAAAHEVAGVLFGERITSIDPDPSWVMPKVPDSIDDWLKRREEINEKILDPATIRRMSEAWQMACSDAWDSGKKLEDRKSVV